MNKDIYPFVAELIEAYERGLIGSISSDPKESNAKALFSSPLRAMESSLMVAETGFATSIFEIQKSEEEKIEESSYAVESAQANAAFYEECKSEVDKDNSPIQVINDDVYLNREDSNPNFEVSVGISRERIRYKMKDFAFLRGSNALDKYLSADDGEITIAGLKTNFGIEKCLDCLIDIELELLTPTIEWIFSLKKLLERIKEVLQLIKNAMDPTTVFGPICAFLNAIKENGLCPRNLPAINLLLPTLFSKYTFDLIKVRLSWTTLLGPLMKGIIGSVVALLENVPRLTNPFFDCVINAFSNLNRYIKTYLASVDKIAKNINDTVHTFDKLVNKAARLGEIAGDSIGITDTENNVSELEAKIEYLNASLLENDFSNENINTNFKMFIKKFVDDKTSEIRAVENDKRKLLILFGRYCIEKETIIVAGNDNKAYAVSIRELEAYLTNSFSGRSVSTISYRDLKNIVEILQSSYLRELEESDINLVDAQAALTQDSNRESLKARDRLALRQKLFEGSGFFTESESIQSVDIDRDRFLSGAQNLDVNGSVRNIRSYKGQQLKKEFYGVQSKINYINPERTFLKSDWATTNLLNDYKNSSINKVIEEILIKKTTEAKKYINDLVQKIIYAFKSLERFMDQYVTLDVQFAGQILELLHVIRFIKTIYRLVKNGFPDCDSIIDKPETIARMLSNEPIVFKVGVDPTRNAVLEDQPRRLIIESTDNQYSTYSDVDDCRNATSSINLNDSNLDNLYAEMLGALNGE